MAGDGHESASASNEGSLLLADSGVVGTSPIVVSYVGTFRKYLDQGSRVIHVAD
jgi:hypothetical protein